MKRLLLLLTLAAGLLTAPRAADGPRAGFSVRSLADLVAIDPRTSGGTTNSSGDWLLNVFVRADGAWYSSTNLGTAWTGTNTSTLLKGVLGVANQHFGWRRITLPAASTASQTDLRSTNNIVAWAAATAYQPSGTITRDGSGVITSMAVKWPDGATGLFTGTANASGFGIDAYSVTYISGGVTNTVTQPTVTRDGAGNVTSAPALTFQ